MEKIFEFYLVTLSQKISYFRHKAWIPGLERKGGGVPCERGGALVQAVRHFHWQVWPATQGGADRYEGEHIREYSSRILGRKPDKGLTSFLPCCSQSCLKISISSSSRNLLQFLESVTVHCKGERRNTPLPYGLRSPYRNLKSENSQDYAQKPQRNFTFMNSASVLYTS